VQERRAVEPRRLARALRELRGVALERGLLLRERRADVDHQTGAAEPGREARAARARLGPVVEQAVRAVARALGRVAADMGEVQRTLEQPPALAMIGVRVLGMRRKHPARLEAAHLAVLDHAHDCAGSRCVTPAAGQAACTRSARPSARAAAAASVARVSAVPRVARSPA
jgi:hypothetical protein